MSYRYRGYDDPSSTSLAEPRIADYKYPRNEYNALCNDSDGKNFCDCMNPVHHANIGKCMYYGRRAEPLAFSIAHSSIQPQERCPLFSVIPREIRDDIYEYALTDCTSHPPNDDNPCWLVYPSTPGWGRRKHNGWPKLPTCDIALPLLQTCKAVYLESFKLPFYYNPFIVFKFGELPSYDVCRPKFSRLAPWQFALIQRLDITLKQMVLEGDKLAKYLEVWRAKERNEGCFVAPRYYQESRSTYPGSEAVQSFSFKLVCPQKPTEDGIPLTLPVRSYYYPGSRSFPHNFRDPPAHSTARAMVARPLTHLTLRLNRTDWSTWTYRPGATQVNHLGLDPSFGDNGSEENERALQPRMIKYADERRAGRWPNPLYREPAPTKYEGSWGAHIAKLPNLKVLELVLETYGAKREQLNTVIDCAKTWKFPLYNVGDERIEWELVWSGRVERANWVRSRFEEPIVGLVEPSVPWDPEDEYRDQDWKNVDRGTEVRIIRFVRRRAGR